MHRKKIKVLLPCLDHAKMNNNKYNVIKRNKELCSFHMDKMRKKDREVRKTRSARVYGWGGGSTEQGHQESQSS